MSTEPFARVIFGGTLAGTSQGWSCGISSLAPADLTALQLLDFADHAATAALAFWNDDLKTLNSPDCFLTHVDVHYYAAAATEATQTANLVISSAPGTSAGTAPTQLALVATLRTAFAGRSNRGRLYLPLAGLQTSELSAHQLVDGIVGAMATSVKNFLVAMNALTLGSSTWTTCIATPRSPGTGHPVTAVVVDSVIDTQRRRRDKVAASSIEVASL